MKKLVSLSIVLVFVLSSCNKNATEPVDSSGSQTKAAQAYSSLEDQFSFWANNSFTNASSYDRLNFQTANSLYKEAISLDPNNTEAQFGAAITEMMSAYSDPQVNDIIKRWESSMNKKSLSKALFNGGFPSSADRILPPTLAGAEFIISQYRVALTDPPLISEMQTILRDKFLPRIVYALERLARVEQDSTFHFRISGKMQGDTKLAQVYLYVTEAYMVDAALQGVRCFLEEFLVYRYDLTDYSQASLVSALSQSNQNFFVAATDAATRAQNAKTALDAVFSKIQSGLGTLQRISGNKPDAVIKLGDIGLAQPEIDSLRSYLQQARNALTTPLTVHLTDWDSQGNSYTVQILLGALFNTPPQNPKNAFFPAYTVTASGPSGISLQFNAATYADFTFPDPTFNGLFPGMTNGSLKRILFIDEAYGYTLDGYVYSDSYYYVTGTVKLQTSTHTYTAVTNQWGDFTFVITDANNVPYRLFINTGTGDIELSGNASFTIRAKTHEWVDIVIPTQPSSLVATPYSNQTRVQLSWLPSSYYAPMIVQRGTGSGSTPVDFDSSYSYGGSFTDYSVTSGITYTYRIRTWNPGQQYYYSAQLRPKTPFYSSIVTITP